MPIGNMLSANEQQYVALKDESGTWRVLNTWHDDIKHLDADSDIPDDSDAVVIFSEGQFIALIKEAGRLGVLANATFGTGEAELENKILEKDQEIIELRDELMKLKEETSKVIQDNTHSEEYILRDKAIVAGHDLKQKAMDNILKLVSIQDMSNLSKE
tara:strand:- start:4502 stop:4975 length:474 start_codon:yes stop_codon:yes gene_type:complete